MTLEPIDIEQRLKDPATYDETILRIFRKRSDRGLGYSEISPGITYFDAAADRGRLSRAIAADIAAGTYRPQPVDLWFLETGGKRRTAHLAAFVDHVVGSALFKLLSHNARCRGLPGVYSYLPGLTNVSAMRALAAYVRDHRRRVGPRGGPLYVLQSDFEKYGDNLPVGPDAALWDSLHDVASLGAPGGDIGNRSWALITELVRPVVRDEDGTQFTRLHGVAMGTPLVPVLGNLAVVPMDRAVTAIDGVFYARYNDDFLVAHGDLAAIHEADRTIDALAAGLGVKRKLAKDLRTALSGHGRPCPLDAAYRGRDRIDCLGMTVLHDGTVALGPHRLRRFIARIAARIDGSAASLTQMTAADRVHHLVTATNVMLDTANPFAVAGLSALLDATTDRGSLKDLDYRIARKIVQAGTGTPGVRGFRQFPPAVLHREMGLVSLVAMRNAR